MLPTLSELAVRYRDEDFVDFHEVTPGRTSSTSNKYSIITQRGIYLRFGACRQSILFLFAFLDAPPSSRFPSTWVTVVGNEVNGLRGRLTQLVLPHSSHPARLSGSFH